MNEIIKILKEKSTPESDSFVHDEYSIGFTDGIAYSIKLIEEYIEEQEVKRMEIIMRNGNNGDHYTE